MKELSLRELQLASLDIAKEIDKVCRENGINYSLAYGSLIGAVLHSFRASVRYYIHGRQILVPMAWQKHKNGGFRGCISA